MEKKARRGVTWGNLRKLLSFLKINISMMGIVLDLNAPKKR